MNTPRITDETLARGARVAALLAAGVFVVLFLAVALARLTYPFELEWMEGGSVDQVRRVLQGQRLYVPPSVEFTPYIYTPLYYWVASVPARILGATFVPLRLVSLFATLASLALIGLIARRESGGWTAGILAAGLYAATFHASGAWFDLGRVDSMFMALTLMGVWLMRRRTDALHQALAAVALFAAFFTKQTALVIAVPLAAYSVYACRGWVRAVLPALLAGLVISSTLGMDALSDGWFTYYVFELPSQHALRPHMWARFWTVDMLTTVSVALVVTFLHLLTLLRPGRGRDLAFLAALLAAMVGASWSARLHDGGWLNSLMPAYAAVAVTFGVAVESLLCRARQGSHRMAALVSAVALAQLVALYHDPLREIPSQGDARGGYKVVRIIERFQGPVMVPDHGYLQHLAGKSTNAAGMALHDVLRGKDPKIRAKLLGDLRQAIRSGRYQAVILDQRGVMAPWVQDEVERHYELKGNIFQGEPVFWPVTGHDMRPRAVWVRRGEPESKGPR